jgi:predicted nucleotidyltransferase component of viral defense system
MNADSIKSRLKNQAAIRGRLFQDELVAYCLERTIYRISVSRYNENFTLKGGIFLYAIFNGSFARSTRDIDLLAKSIDNTIDVIKIIFEEIFAIDTDDAIIYDLNSLSVERTAEFKENQGINVSIVAMLNRTRVPVSIDIGFGDVIYPNRVMMDFPVLLDMDVPRIYAYSISSVIAEKFEAIVSLGYVNSRYKDFYDIYILSRSFNFDGEELYNSIKETFSNRGTSFDDIVAFEHGFSDDKMRVARWGAFLKKRRLMMEMDFSDAMEGVRVFLEPIIEKLRTQEIFTGEWRNDENSWRIES